MRKQLFAFIGAGIFLAGQTCNAGLFDVVEKVLNGCEWDVLWIEGKTEKRIKIDGAPAGEDADIGNLGNGWSCVFSNKKKSAQYRELICGRPPEPIIGVAVSCEREGKERMHSSGTNLSIVVGETHHGFVVNCICNFTDKPAPKTK